MDSGDTATFTVTNGSVTSVNGRTGDVEGLAEEDGYYSTMTVGRAENLFDTRAAGSPRSFTFAPTAGDESIEEDGTAEIKSVHGNTLVWNQLVGADTASVALTNGHVYFTRISGVESRMVGDGSEIEVSSGDAVHDLTKMFGSGREPATAADFRALFPRTDYAYDAGRFLNFTGTGLRSVGFNLLNPATGKANIPAGYECQITGTYTALTAPDGTAATPDSDGIFTASLRGEYTVTGGTSSTVIHLVHGGYRSGETEAYTAQMREVPVQTYFPDGMRSTKAVYDELTKEKAIRRIGVYVFTGSETWTWKSGNSDYWQILFSASYGGKNSSPVLLSNGILASLYYNTSASQTLRVQTVSNPGITSETDIRALFPAGTVMYYALAEPIETEITPALNLTYAAHDFGTEEILHAEGDEPVTSPFSGNIAYSVDYVRAHANMPKNYTSQDTLDGLLNTLGEALGGTITKTWDAQNNRWSFSAIGEVVKSVNGKTGDVDGLAEQDSVDDLSKLVNDTFYGDPTSLEFDELSSESVYHNLGITLISGHTYSISLTLSGFSSSDLSKITSIAMYANATSSAEHTDIKSSFAPLKANERMTVEFVPTFDAKYARIGYLSAYSSESNSSVWEIRDISDNRVINAFADIDKMSDIVDQYGNVDFSKLSKYEWSINNSVPGKWVAVTNGVTKSYIIDIAGAESITLFGNNVNTGYYALIADVDNITDGAVVSMAPGRTARSTLTAKQEKFLSKTDMEGARYLYVSLTGSGSVDMRPRKIVIERNDNLYDKIASMQSDIERLKQLLFSGTFVNGDNEDIPQNQGVRNALARLERLRTMPWTSLAEIPLNSAYGQNLQPGSQTGIIYSSVKEMNKFVGWNVSLRTFLTAAHNPYSLLYTENVSAANSHSEYGFEYHGSNCASYFGIVCSIFTMYGYGWREYWSSREIPHLWRHSNFIIRAEDQSATGVRLMDLIQERGHVSVITGVTRDEQGVPTNIELCETYHPHPVKKNYTPAQFNERMRSEQEVIYRYPDISKVTAMESIDNIVYNDDICTFAGDYAAFYEGEPVWINYNYGNTTYTGMELYKGNTLVNTYTLDTSAHAIDISADVSEYGEYKARLTGNGNSDYTYFTVVEADVTCTNDNNVLTVTFSSANGTPEFIQLCYANGTSRGVYPLSEDEIAAGSATFDAIELLRSQYEFEFTDHTESGNRFDEQTFVKVFFRCANGVVRNAPIDTEIVPVA